MSCWSCPYGKFSTQVNFQDETYYRYHRFEDSIVVGSSNWDQVKMEDWTYDKRRSMQEILPGVFLGPLASIANSEFKNLIDQKITHIICVRSRQEAPFMKPKFGGHFRYLEVEIEDNENESIIRHFVPVKDFIDSALGSKGKVLVHGIRGISRSASLIIAYIMQKYKPNYRLAYEFVRVRRFCILPNPGFCAQLQEFEAICAARLNQGEDSGTNRDILSRNSCPAITVREKEPRVRYCDWFLSKTREESSFPRKILYSDEFTFTIPIED